MKQSLYRVSHSFFTFFNIMLNARKKNELKTQSFIYFFFLGKCFRSVKTLHWSFGNWIFWARALTSLSLARLISVSSLISVNFYHSFMLAVLFRSIFDPSADYFWWNFLTNSNLLKSDLFLRAVECLHQTLAHQNERSLQNGFIKSELIYSN